MVDIPVACNIQGDYGFKVIVVDDEDTMTEVIRKATEQIVGVLVKQFPPDAKLIAKIHGADTPLPNTATVKGENFRQMEAIDIYQEG